MKKDLEKEFENLGKKHKLPSYKELNAEFEISSIEHTEFLTREIRRKMMERLEYFASLLCELLQPEANLSSLLELKYFDDDEKAQAYKSYKKIMRIRREADLLTLSQEEKEEATFILKVFEEWIEMKRELSSIIVKLRDSWKKESEGKEVLGYLG